MEHAGSIDLDAVIQITVAVVDSVELTDTLRAHASAGTARDTGRWNSPGRASTQRPRGGR
jgi:hypothetical protein